MPEVTYYFDAKTTSNWTDSANMIDGVLTNYASASSNGITESLSGNTCPGDDLGMITKVEIRVYGYGDDNDRIDLWVKGGFVGDEHQTTPGVSAGWSSYIDISSDTNAPSPWAWSDVVAVDIDVERATVSKANTMYCAKVEIRVTYWVPPESDIDVGSAPLNRNSTFIPEYTLIDKSNPANAGGTLQSIKVWANTNITGFRVGTFYVVSGNTLKCRDSVSIGAVTFGSEQEFTGLSLTVVAGDYIGCYYSVGAIERDLSGFGGLLWINSENIDPDDEATYTLSDGNAISLYGYGDVVGAAWKQIQYTSEPPTSNAWNQLKHTSAGGWNRIDYEGE